MNIPNKLTVARLALTAIFFVVLAADDPGLLYVSLIIFIIAAFTDLVDGWYARKYQMVTDFGRVADPFADKILVCGALVFLLVKKDSPVRDWMVVIIIAREFLVSGMRSLAESKGIPFGATYWGKFKALSQNFAVGFSIFHAASGLTQVRWISVGFLYLATTLTAISGCVYLFRAKRILHIDT
ncbi:MAG: CDP-diacylglycerol--glycerol-3-phosphate 3-phosphatidyltransferase [Planctomycetes bacterium]|nr:CDP-diacylglycerol--glycerol-3-phosphate 3-phosphatidyltransferase [Planctomycetota bacterium]